MKINAVVYRVFQTAGCILTLAVGLNLLINALGVAPGVAFNYYTTDEWVQLLGLFFGGLFIVAEAVLIWFAPKNSTWLNVIIVIAALLGVIMPIYLSFGFIYPLLAIVCAILWYLFENRVIQK